MLFASQYPCRKSNHHWWSSHVHSLKSLSFEIQNDNADGYTFFLKVGKKVRVDPKLQDLPLSSKVNFLVNREHIQLIFPTAGAVTPHRLICLLHFSDIPKSYAATQRRLQRVFCIILLPCTESQKMEWPVQWTFLLCHKVIVLSCSSNYLIVCLKSATTRFTLFF